MNKYQALSDRLASHPRDQWGASFAELEEILGFPLPKSAREREAWWSNETLTDRSQKLAWLNEGWRVETVDQAAELVTFRRVAQPPAKAQKTPAPAPAAPEAAPAVARRAPAVVAPPIPRALGFAALVAVGAALGVLVARAIDQRD
ncbi:MAG: hypothetical protein ABI655_07465 [Phenylobacterium sp.]